MDKKELISIIVASIILAWGFICIGLFIGSNVVCNYD